MVELIKRRQSSLGGTLVKVKKEDKTVPTICVSTIESSRRHLLGEGGSPWDTSKLVFDTLIWWWMW
jgi:hypothetical protein